MSCLKTKPAFLILYLFILLILEIETQDLGTKVHLQPTPFKICDSLAKLLVAQARLELRVLLIPVKMCITVPDSILNLSENR